MSLHVAGRSEVKDAFKALSKLYVKQMKSVFILGFHLQDSSLYI